MKLKCPRCNYDWNYTGNKEKDERVSCPSCWYKFTKAEGME